MSYYIFYFVIFILNIAYNISKKKKMYLLITLALFIFFVGFRYEVGTDWANYKLMFDGKNLDVEKSYIYLSKLFHIFNLNFSIFILSLFIISFLLKVEIIKKYSELPILSLVIYIPTILIMYDMNGLRQGLALGITFFSTKYIIERKKIKYFICLGIAIFIHISAVVFIPAFYIAKLKFLIKKRCIIGMFLVSFFINNYKNVILKMVEIIKEEWSLRFFDKLYIYAQSLNYSNNILGFFLKTLIFFICMYIVSKRKEYEIMGRLYAISYYIYIIFYRYGEIGTRGAAYYKIYEIILIPLLISLSKKKINKLCSYIFIISYTFLILNKYLILENNGLIPYRNIFYIKEK